MASLHAFRRQTRTFAADLQRVLQVLLELRLKLREELLELRITRVLRTIRNFQHVLQMSAGLIEDVALLKIFALLLLKLGDLRLMDCVELLRRNIDAHALRNLLELIARLLVILHHLLGVILHLLILCLLLDELASLDLVLVRAGEVLHELFRRFLRLTLALLLRAGGLSLARLPGLCRRLPGLRRRLPGLP